MISWFKQLDDLLRGRKTGPQMLTDGRIELPLSSFVPLAILLGATYGFFMGWYAIFTREPAIYMPLLASAVKLPALFLVTLIVTFPSLYVFNALVGCRLSFTSTLRLLVGAIVVNVAVAASFGPILAFFTVSTTSYPFMIILNVILMAVAGVVGLAFLLHTLGRLAVRPWQPPTPSPPPDGDNPADPEATAGPPREIGPLDRLEGETPDEAIGQARSIFRIWVIIYGLVGAQTAWLLRPFIGSPHLEFSWFRPRSGNFFLSVFTQLRALFDVGP